MHLMVISGPDGKLVAAIKEMTGKKTNSGIRPTGELTLATSRRFIPAPSNFGPIQEDLWQSHIYKDACSLGQGNGLPSLNYY